MIVSRWIKYLVIKCKEMEDLYTQEYKTLLKEIKDNLNKWKDNPCPKIGKLHTVKMAALCKVIHWFKAIPNKIPIANVAKMEKILSKSLMEFQGILSNILGGLLLPSFPDSKLTTRLTRWKSRCNGKDMNDKSTGWMVQRWTHTSTEKWLSTRAPRASSWQRAVFSTNCIRKTRYIKNQTRPFNL